MKSKQNKAKFIVDNYIELKGIPDLALLVAWLECRDVMFVVEPWFGNKDKDIHNKIFRVYVRKEVKHELESGTGIFGGKYDAANDGKGVSK